MADNSALQKAPKLTLDEAWQATLFLLSASQESLQVLLDDLVQQGLLGLTPLILDGLGPLRDPGGGISMDAISVPGCRGPLPRARAQHGGEAALVSGGYQEAAERSWQGWGVGAGCRNPVAGHLQRALARRCDESLCSRPGGERETSRPEVLAQAERPLPTRLDRAGLLRRANTRDLPRYLEAALAGSPPEVLDAPTARGEAVFLALRSAAGLDARRFASEFGRPPRGFWEEAIVGLIARGLLQERLGGDLKLTRRGRLLSDSVFEHFV